MSLICTTNDCDFKSADGSRISLDGGGRSLCPDCGLHLTNTDNPRIEDIHLAKKTTKDALMAMAAYRDGLISNDDFLTICNSGAWMDALSIIVFSPHVAEQMLKDYVKAIGVDA